MNQSARLADAARPGVRAALTEVAKRRIFPALLSLIEVFFSPAGSGEAVDPLPSATGSRSSIQQLLQRLELQNARLDEQNKRLAEQNAKLAEQNHTLERRLENVEGRAKDGMVKTPVVGSAAAASEGNGGSDLQSLNKPTADGGAAAASAEAAAVPMAPKATTVPAHAPVATLRTDDDERPRGQVVVARSKEGADMPFELRADLFSEVRLTYFDERASNWIDSAGNVLPIRNFDTLELTRNFIQLSGYAIDPRLQFTANLFSSTALNSTNYLGWINFRFNRGFDIRAGNWIVPGTREWFESFRYTMGSDRLMATTFFRPNISPGIWVQGEPLDNVHYVAMVANSLNRFNQGVQRIGTARAFGGTLWWEPFGVFGPGPSDIEDHTRLSPRFGTSAAFSRESNQGFGGDETGNPEDTILRLSDGTPLFRPGALAPGVELRSVNVNLWTIDMALKYRGFALSGEYFLRWLNNFNHTGGELPKHQLFDHGALLQSGYFVIPGRLEGFARSSFVTGDFGGGYEAGGGLNWYIRGNRDWRMTFEVLNVNRSPAQNLLTGYRAGASGTLYQLQLFTDFF